MGRLFMVIDFHAHAFRDELAKRTLPELLREATKHSGAEDLKAFSDGTISGLRASMKKAGIDKTVIMNIATKPKQAGAILEWCQELQSKHSDALFCFPSFHPLDPKACDWLRKIAAAGFKGIKLHPYFQGFSLDDSQVISVMKSACDQGLSVVCHCGFDISYPRERICDPPKVAALMARLPKLRFIAAHMGGWEDWDLVEQFLLGKDVYLDTAFTLPFLGPSTMIKLLTRHRPDRLLFGSDSPWMDQAESLVSLKALSKLGLSEEVLKKILDSNPKELLALKD